MVAGSVTTHNGIACTIQNSDNMPIVVSQGGSNTSTNQAINSSVQITPTIISFDRQDPSQSLIKLNINTQLSVITNQNPIAGASYTTKTLTTTRIIRANGEPIVAGSFVTDQNMPGNYYVPILGQIPVLKWLFSYQTYNVQRELSMLFVSVKLVPQTQLMGS
ncbi:MAG: type II and III secretion system protein, partial [Negativicutes bacterium]|nr:type II and III secretion system protein [Negativicutes bacterium]